MSNLQTHCYFKLDFKKLHQHTGGKWLSNGTKHRKDNQLQASNCPAEYPGRKSKLDKTSMKIKFSIQYSMELSRGRNIQGSG